MNPEVREKYADISKLQKEIADECGSLALSLELQELWPEAFGTGPCKTKLVNDEGSGQMTNREWHKTYKGGRLFVRITRKDGRYVDINARMVSRKLLMNHNFRPWEVKFLSQLH